MQQTTRLVQFSISEHLQHVSLPLHHSTLRLPILLRGQLIDVLLREEFGGNISEQLISLPSSEIAKERNKQARRNKHVAAIADSRAGQETYIQSWPQVIPKNIVYKCLNAYHQGTEWTTSAMCCVCSRRQHDVEICDIVMRADEEIPGYFQFSGMRTYLYQSSVPARPTMFHGNTCAHEVNVVSMAAVLPRAPSDVNGLLSVVFIGPFKFKPEYLRNMYRIWKQNVWSFLQSHNRLYKAHAN